MSVERWTAKNTLPDRKGKRVEEDIAEFIEKHRPKQINQYEENGHTIRVFESRYAN